MGTVLITGANRGIGLALAKLYALRGDKVIACCRDEQAAGELPTLPGVTIAPLSVDNEQSVAALAARVSNVTLDTLINNAGIIGQPRENQTATTMDFSVWEQIHAVNTMGPVRVMQALLPPLTRAKHPKVANVTSDLGALSHDDPIFLGYSASKAALNKFMRLAAIELKPQGIAIGLIHPGWVQTDMGGHSAPITPTESAAGIVEVIDRLSLENTGGFWTWAGERHDW